MNLPKDLRYTAEHTWLRVADDLGTVGITDFAQEELGDIVFLKFPRVGSQTRAGAAFGEIESVKTVSDLIAPVSGEVVEVNAALHVAPETVNLDPYGGGWLVVIRLRDPAEIDRLLDAAGYEAVV